jgi:hypothetical protein
MQEARVGLLELVRSGPGLTPCGVSLHAEEEYLLMVTHRADERAFWQAYIGGPILSLIGAPRSSG